MLDEDLRRWSDAVLAAAALATDPLGLRGVVVRARAGSLRDAWLDVLKGFLGRDVALRRMPVHATPDRILGGLDLTATLNAGRPVAERGLLAQADGGIILVGSAERLTASTAALLASALDRREVVLERDGLTQCHPARFALVIMDEGASEDEAPAVNLTDRLAIGLSIDDLRAGRDVPFTRGDVQAAQTLLVDVAIGDDLIEALDATAAQFGVRTLNASFLATRVARVVAALAGRLQVTEEDAAAAARLVIAPRATVAPADQEQTEAESPPPPESGEEQKSDLDSGTLQDMMVAAAKAAIPSNLLELMRSGVVRRKATSVGRSGNATKSLKRGRPSGVRPGALRGGARLNVIETLRAAAPWQRLRREMRGDETSPPARSIEIRPDDFRIKRLKHRAETATIFVVDASGSTAISRLAEAKGAIELLLADCYVRRDQVALIAFGGRGSELLLAPTRSLARAKRDLAGLPGGGGTPLAAGIAAAAALADKVRRKGQTPTVVMLTDGRANLALDGRAERARAMSDALTAASTLKIDKVAALLIDTSNRPQQEAARVADAMGARYLPLPHGDAEALSHAVRTHVRERGP
jgi:magnesium chelatase subunit D